MDGPLKSGCPPGRQFDVSRCFEVSRLAHQLISTAYERIISTERVVTCLCHDTARSKKTRSVASPQRPPALGA
jgi:hypothetical protein